MKKSSDTLTAMGIGLVALVIRLLYLWLEWQFDIVDGHFYSGDAFVYDTLAQSIVNGNGYVWGGKPTAYVVPGYPTWLALWYSTVGRNLPLIGAIQCVLGALTCVWVYLIGRRAFDARTATVAGLFAALLPELVMWTSGQILTEPLYIFLLTSAVLLLILAISSSTARATAIAAGTAGLVLGAASLTRPTAFMFALLAVLYVLKTAGWRRAGLVAAGTAMFLIPWTVRNARQLGAAVATSTDSGWVFYLYHGPETTAENGGYDPHVKRPAEIAVLPEVDQNQFFRREALATFRREPQRELALSVNRFWNTFRPTYAGSSTRNRTAAFATYVPLAIFGIMGLVATWRRNRVSGLLAIFVAFHVAFHTLVAGELRFRMPLMPVFSVFAAISLMALWRRLARFRFRLSKRDSPAMRRLHASLRLARRTTTGGRQRAARQRARIVHGYSCVAVTFLGLWRFRARYQRVATDEIARSFIRRTFLRSLPKLVSALETGVLVRGPAVVRAQVMTRSGDLIQDFQIVQAENSVHVINAPSPGATASLAMGAEIARMAESCA